MAKRRTAKPQPESRLVAACIELLNTIPGVVAWRQSVGAARVGDRLIRFGKVGMSDIVGWMAPRGRWLAVECKIGRNKPTAPQQEFLDSVNRAGGYGIVVRDTVDGLLEAVQAAMREGE